MAESNETSRVLEDCLTRLRRGDVSARDELIAEACQRLTRLTRKMLHDYPRVHRWEETDDVFQRSVMRICKALEQVTPASVTEFIRLAACQIRRELIDLARHYYGPHGLGAHHLTNHGSADLASIPRTGESREPSRLIDWAEFHQRIDELPQELRQVFDLVWYQGLSQLQAAGLLGVHERTIRRRWREACISVRRSMRGTPPGVL
ncbi:MAG TPA: sigma-70 family RNA polymerase sigma factor [Pirellulaceae bacterium]